MWTFRLGAARAKQLMFTGDLLSGSKAAEWGLANVSVPAAELDDACNALADRIAGVPRSHLAMHKLVVNQVMLTAGLEQAQTLATVFDGITRHNPEGLWFRRQAQAEGFKSATVWRDSGKAIPEGDEARALAASLSKRVGKPSKKKVDREEEAEGSRAERQEADALRRRRANAGQRGSSPATDTINWLFCDCR